MPVALDEAGILRGVRSSSRRDRDRAFEELFRAMGGPVYQLCYRITGSAAEADDAVQDCFVAAGEALTSFRGDAALSTWIYRIALRAAWRRKARTRARREEPGDEGQSAAMTVAVAPGDEPERQAAAREEVRRVTRALATLSEEHQAILSLFAVDGLKHQEIAAVLGVPEGTVWSRLHAARKALVAALPG